MREFVCDVETCKKVSSAIHKLRWIAGGMPVIYNVTGFVIRWGWD